MEVQHHHHMGNSPPLDFNFIQSGGRSSPCSTTSAGAGGGRFNFISAPTSPSRASEFYRDFDDFSAFDQMEQEHEFAFHVSTDIQAAKTSVSAEELFDHGRIRSPMAQQPNRPYSGGGAEPPISVKSPLLSPFGSPKPKGRKSFWDTFTPKSKKHNAIKPNPYAPVTSHHKVTGDQERGRGRGPSPSTSASGRRVTRSLSPTRAPTNPSTNAALTGPAPAKSSRRWKLTNFLLFRSASEGHASDKDPMRKLTSFYRRSSQEELKASTSRTAEINKNSNNNSTSNNVAPIRRSGQPVSAHERHYTTNKAVSEDLRKKTFLPYKQGILGRLAVNPNVHALAYGFGSLPSS